MSISRYCKHYNLLFSPDLVQRVFERLPKYDVPVDKGLNVRDEAQRAYRLARAANLDYQAEAISLQQYVHHILEKVLGYTHITECPDCGISPEEAENKQDLFQQMYVAGSDSGTHLFPISLLLGAGTNKPVLPVIITPADKTLDAKINFNTGSRLSATQMMQAFLNASEYYTWAIVTNGTNWRLLRDNPALSRPCYLEIDLDRLLEEENSTAFDGLFWRVLHVSRASRQISGDGETCIWEQWRQDLEEHGARAREGLREGVEKAICQLGTGFLQGSGAGNAALRTALQSGTFTTQAFYQELMRTVYRLIFLTVLEGRNILHEHDKTLKEQAQLYHQGYSITRLIKRAERENTASCHDDLWQAQLIVFRALGKDGGETALALPALGGLYDAMQCPWLDACRLPNKAFLGALRSLCWTRTEGNRTQVDYAHIGAEELGSVYESLLELTPRFSSEQRIFYFLGGLSDPEESSKKQKGNARKSSGSYYTPACLVEQVLKTALDPLLEECCKNPVYANNKLLALRVIDPSCGSGHFLLAAARRIAERLADARTPGQMGGTTPEVFQRAMHDVISQCIYGVDINPMAIELVRMNLWLEGYQPGKPLSFLDHHLQVGNSLVGIMDVKCLTLGIPGDAYKAQPGDDSEVCKGLKKANDEALKPLRKGNKSLPITRAPSSADWKQMPEDTPSQVQTKAERWQELSRADEQSLPAIAADMWVGTFLLPKTQMEGIPSTGLLEGLASDFTKADDPAVLAAQQVCRAAHVFHWPLRFPEIFERGGFDCVLGNPPWDRHQLREEEYFAAACPPIAQAANADTRKPLIELLRIGQLANSLAKCPGEPSESEISLYADYIREKRKIKAEAAFFHVSAERGGRFPVKSGGIINLYALFTELNNALRCSSGRAGFIVPTGISTDDSTKELFKSLVQSKQLASLYDFENKGLFSSVHDAYKFSCITLFESPAVDFVYYLHHPRELMDARRHFSMQAGDFSLISPNTETSPLFRCEADASLCKKIYKKAAILMRDTPLENPWKIKLHLMYMMDVVSRLAKREGPEQTLPVYEGKMIQQYDHRWATFTSSSKKADPENCSESEHQNPHYEPRSRYKLSPAEAVVKIPKEAKCSMRWLLTFRNITNAMNERTSISAFIPFRAVGDTATIIYFHEPNLKLISCLLANLNSIPFDYVARIKVGGLHINFHHIKQFPVLPPEVYSPADVDYISNRVLELTYTSESMRPWAEDMGYMGAPFAWDPDRRAQLRAELDARIAKLYDLTRKELEYILDPQTLYGEDCPTETFRSLQRKEERDFGEYRTKRLVLAAFDKLTQQSM